MRALAFACVWDVGVLFVPCYLVFVCACVCFVFCTDVATSLGCPLATALCVCVCMCLHLHLAPLEKECLLHVTPPVFACLHVSSCCGRTVAGVFMRLLHLRLRYHIREGLLATCVWPDLFITLFY